MANFAEKFKIHTYHWEIATNPAKIWFLPKILCNIYSSAIEQWVIEN
jgi:hypothetical protein